MKNEKEPAGRGGRRHKRRAGADQPIDVAGGSLTLILSRPINDWTPSSGKDELKHPDPPIGGTVPGICHVIVASQPFDPHQTDVDNPAHWNEYLRYDCPNSQIKVTITHDRGDLAITTQARDKILRIKSDVPFDKFDPDGPSTLKLPAAIIDNVQVDIKDVGTFDFSIGNNDKCAVRVTYCH